MTLTFRYGPLRTLYAAPPGACQAFAKFGCLLGRGDFTKSSFTTEEEEPLYFFLFTHTEDPFNYELSEERYLRLVPEVMDRAASHPDADLAWTIMFQGTDARSVAERTPETGVADLLRSASEAGMVHFGYHAHHEATYANRPQNSFTDDSSWSTLVEGMVDWLGCKKDVSHGGCIAPDGGGVNAVQQYFGPVEAVSAQAPRLPRWQRAETLLNVTAGLLVISREEQALGAAQSALDAARATEVQSLQLWGMGLRARALAAQARWHEAEVLLQQ